MKSHKSKRINSSLIIISLILFGATLYLMEEKEKKSPTIEVEIYTISGCPNCEYAKEHLPMLLEKEFQDVNILIVDMDDDKNITKHEEILRETGVEKSILSDSYPLINIKERFVIIGYDNSFGYEIINDIKRFDSSSVLGIKLKKNRFLYERND